MQLMLLKEQFSLLNLLLLLGAKLHGKTFCKIIMNFNSLTVYFQNLRNSTLLTIHIFINLIEKLHLSRDMQNCAFNYLYMPLLGLIDWETDE